MGAMLLSPIIFYNKEFEMKKMWFLLSVVLMLVISLGTPAQIASGAVIYTEFVMNGIPVTPLVCEKQWSEDGVTHLRNCSISLLYSATDNRFVGQTNMVLSRNIFPDGSARGHGSWVHYPYAYPDGYWVGTFTASVDSLGVLRVKMIGKGYGTLSGLFYSGDLEGNMLSTINGVITELPTY
jgi:hypothetical protein